MSLWANCKTKESEMVQSIVRGSDSVVVSNALAFRKSCLLIVQFASIESTGLVHNLSLENI